MVKLRSSKSQEKRVTVTPSPNTNGTPNAYESLRLARIAENQARMAALGVQRHAGQLKSMFKVTKSSSISKPKTSSRKPISTPTPSRRSERIKGKGGPPALFHSDTGNKLLFEIEDEGSGRNFARNNYEDDGEPRPANAPLPTCSPVQLELSSHILARRCNSKTRGSIYDPILGICCHFCRQKKLCGEEGCERCGDRDGTKACLGKTDCSVCHSSTGVFCRACLKVRYGEDIDEVRQNKNWMCPHCSEEKGINPYWICNSSLCLKKRKIPPTGIAIFIARELGYKSVAHYFADQLKKKGFSG